MPSSTGRLFLKRRRHLKQKVIPCTLWSNNSYTRIIGFFRNDWMKFHKVWEGGLFLNSILLVKEGETREKQSGSVCLAMLHICQSR